FSSTFMTFFNVTEPVLRRKQTALDVQDLCGLLKIKIELGNKQLFSALFTRIDQVLLLWSAIALLIFSSGQFLPVSWLTQAYLSSLLTVAAITVMILFTRFWTKVEQLSWVMYFWTGLMLFSLGLTNIGIFGSWGIILIHLCPLWLGSCACGYIVTGFGLRSRLFILIGIAHLLGIVILPLIPSLQFLITGFIIAASLILLSAVQWDMREPIASPVLSEADQEFNWQQQAFRQKNDCSKF
ncbi:MAG: hypothetical protein RI580_19200, partial [Halothece sp. Uz-M2-17]|nr:hypothetical protein [Halothece sp. Uz-M2-17]